MKSRRFFYFFIIWSVAISCHDDPPESGFTQFIWSTSTPTAQGIDSQILDSAFIAAENLGYVDGLLVIRNGYLVAEKYYNGYFVNTPHNIKSVSKSFLSAISGIAIQKGYFTLEDKVMDYFPEYIYDTMDVRKYDITIDDLMIMRMGIDTEENNLLDVLATSNWIKTTIELPLLSAPGEKFRYSTLETHLLSAILTKTSGMSTYDLTKKYLTDFMGIDIDGWSQDPQGYYFGGSEMYFTPREMAVLGYLYLNEGKLRDVQIVPADWVATSLSKTWEKDSKEWGVLKEYNYGHLWWLGKINGYEMYWALGYGGQMVITFPDLNLIVVTTAGYDIGWDVDQERPILEVVSKYILPAIN
jgi:CubicO group peptidase (beta-lactamase class C family)